MRAAGVLVNADLFGQQRVAGHVCSLLPGARIPAPRDNDLIKQVTHLASVAIEHDGALTGLQRAHIELEKRVRDRTAELVLANERLKELDHLKSLFLASMSHELRTPLNSIIGFTGILNQGLAGPVNAEQQKQLGIIVVAARHLLSLINDLLDVSRIEAGKMEIERAPFDFVPVVNEAIESMVPMATQKNLRLTCQVPVAQSLWSVIANGRCKCS